MNVGLYFGSFNPIHVGHLIIANHVLNFTDLKKIWFVVSPQNPFKERENLLNEYHRLHLLRLAIEEDVRMRAIDIEFNLPKPSYTATTLIHLEERYPEHHFSILMGSDSFQNLHKWKNYETIIKNYSIYVYIRPGFEVNNIVNAKLQILKAPLLDISATTIRQTIREKKSVRYLVPDKVKEEIDRGGYYQNELTDKKTK